MDRKAIIESMVERGYEPLSVGEGASIGFRKSLKEKTRYLASPVWFDTGRTMPAVDRDGRNISIRRTVCAYTEAEVEEFKQKGWQPIYTEEVNPDGDKSRG